MTSQQLETSVFSKFSSITDYSGLRFRALEASTGYHELASVGSAGQRLPINIYVQGFTNQLVLENTGDITMNTGDLSVVNGNVEIGTYLEIANSSFTYSPPGAGHYAFNCGAGAVFNEDGADRDFRIEAVGRPYAFAIDGASGAVAVNLDPAGAGFRFTVNGGTAITGLLKTDAGLRHLIQEVEDSNLTLTGIEYTVLMKATLSSVTITLDAVPNTGQVYNIKCIDDANTCTIARNGKLIDGDASDIVLIEDESATLQYDGTEWWII
jgi:hypothetical protein